MVPNVNDGLTKIEIKQMPSKTYRLDIQKEEISGYCDRLEAVKQAVYKILNTQRYQYLIYSWNYGVEFADLFGLPGRSLFSVIENRIREALMQDDRITDVTDFAFQQNKGNVHVTFRVISTAGEFEEESVVETSV